MIAKNFATKFFAKIRIKFKSAKNLSPLEESFVFLDAV